jgi:hypothetical protein
VPAAKYHSVFVCVAHDATSKPLPPSTPSSTTIRVPNVSIVSAPGGPIVVRFFVTTDNPATGTVV